MTEQSAQSAYIHVENTNRWSTRQLVTMALLVAVGAIFSFVALPIFPAAAFLTYDPSLVPAMVAGFAFGTGPGVAVGVLIAVLHGLLTGEWVGSLMNIVATLGYILPAAIIYARSRTYKAAIGGLVLSMVVATVASVVANLTIGVAFWYGTPDAVLPLVVPALIPFNLLKTFLNSLITLGVYKAISNSITPEKDQVQGKE